MRPHRALVLGLLAVPLAPGCANGAGPAPQPSAATETRSFAMGLSDFPHAFTPEAVAFAAEAVRNDADLSMLHFDDGVPWEEAAAGAPYPAEYQADLERRARSRPAGHLRYLAVTPMSFMRDGLAARRGRFGSEPLRPPWDTRRFDDRETIQAYLAHCERMLALFEPDYFVYGVEVNLLAVQRPDLWPSLVRLLAAVHEWLRTQHPDLPASLTFQVDFLRALPDPQSAAIREVMPFSDLVGASTYAYSKQSDPRALPDDFFDGLVALAPGKRFFIAETGWPGESVTSPYPAFIPSGEEEQRLFVEWLFGQGERHRAEFINWILTRDYDDLWESHAKNAPDAALLRLWKDLGLYRGDGTPRPSREVWRAWLARPRR